MTVKRVNLLRVGSTNHYLSNLLKENPGTGQVLVVADFQDTGKGQGDHQWHSLPGENLLMSLLLFPAFLSASHQFHLSRVASLALVDTLKRLNLAPVIKWPNDILVNNRKIAGILIENGISGKRLSHTIIGIGLNLNQTKFPVFPVEATSVALETGIISDRNSVTGLLLDSILARYHQLEKGNTPDLESDYLEHLFLLNQTGDFTVGGKRVTGIIRGLSDLGELLMEHDAKTRNYGFQEIQYLMGKN
ncbi:MAG: biotin--[acetyl-CoA-carboxylase] ligase [Bacteroidales bacterium]